MDPDARYIVTLRIFGSGEWPYGFDDIDDAAEQAREWCAEALKARHPADYQITFERSEPPEKQE